MQEWPLSGAVAPKHRLVLETALLLQCPLYISQDASVSMETAAEQATAVRVLPSALAPPLVLCSTPCPACFSWLLFLFPHLQYSGVAGALHAAVQA